MNQYKNSSIDVNEFNQLFNKIGDKTLTDLYNQCEYKYIRSLDYAGMHIKNMYYFDDFFDIFLNKNYGKDVVYKVWVIYENTKFDLYPILDYLDRLFDFIYTIDNNHSYESYGYCFDHDAINTKLIYYKEYFLKCARFIENESLIKFILVDYDDYIEKNREIMKENYYKKTSETKKRKDEIANNYFNFIDFDVEEYNKELNNFLDIEKSKKYLINDLNVLNNNNYNDNLKYGVLLIKNDKVIDVFFTSKVSEVVGKHMNEHKADSVFIHEIKNNDYATTLKADLSIFYDVKNENINTFRCNNYKYGTLKRAKTSYCRKYGITAKAFKKIELESCYVKVFPSSDVIVNKLKLHENVKNTISELEKKLKEIEK